MVLVADHRSPLIFCSQASWYRNKEVRKAHELMSIVSLYLDLSRLDLIFQVFFFLMRALFSTSSAAATAAAATTTCFTYLLGATHTNTLYVPLTSRCNARTLPMTRGVNFTLPPLVVAALCRVRNAEHYGHCDNKNDTIIIISDNDVSPQKLPDYPYEFISNIIMTSTTSTPTTTAKNTATTGSTTTALTTTTGRPTVDELLLEIVSATTKNSGNDEIKSIVIGGEGEPLLRYNSLLSLIQQIHQHVLSTSSSSIDNNLNSTIMPTRPKIRLTTNGLVDPLQAVACTRQLYEAGLNAVSVALMTHDARQYQDLMQPLDMPLQLPLLPMVKQDSTLGMVEESTTTTRTIPPPLTSSSMARQQQQQQRPLPPPAPVAAPPQALDWVCHFCRAAVQAGLEVELTAIDRPDIVDKAATEKLATQLLAAATATGSCCDDGSSSSSSSSSSPKISQLLLRGRQQQQHHSSVVVRWRPYFP